MFQESLALYCSQLTNLCSSKKRRSAWGSHLDCFVARLPPINPAVACPRWPYAGIQSQFQELFCLQDHKLSGDLLKFQCTSSYFDPHLLTSLRNLPISQPIVTIFLLLPMPLLFKFQTKELLVNPESMAPQLFPNWWPHQLRRGGKRLKHLIDSICWL
jgi:hypothetical protein